MSRPRFLADHDCSEDILHGAERLEPTIEIVRAREVGLHESPDDEVLAYAASQQMATLSHDVNTMSAAAKTRILAGQAMHGLFLVQQRSVYRPIIEDLVLLTVASEAEEWVNQIQFLPL